METANFLTPLVVGILARYLERADKRALYQTAKMFATIHDQKEYTLSVDETYYIKTEQRLYAIQKMMPSLQNLSLRIIYHDTPRPSAGMMAMLKKVPHVHLFLQNYSIQGFQSWFKVNWPFPVASVYADACRMTELSRVQQRKLVKCLEYMRPKELRAEDPMLLNAVQVPNLKKTLILNECPSMMDASSYARGIEANNSKSWSQWAIMLSWRIRDVPALYDNVDYIGMEMLGITAPRWEAFTGGRRLKEQCPRLKSVHLVYNFCSATIVANENGAKILQSPFLWIGKSYISPLSLVLKDASQNDPENTYTTYLYFPTNITVEGWKTLVRQGRARGRSSADRPPVKFVCITAQDARVAGYFNRCAMASGAKGIPLCGIRDPELNCIQGTHFHSWATVETPIEVAWFSTQPLPEDDLMKRTIDSAFLRK